MRLINVINFELNFKLVCELSTGRAVVGILYVIFMYFTPELFYELNRVQRKTVINTVTDR